MSWYQSITKTSESNMRFHPAGKRSASSPGPPYSYRPLIMCRVYRAGMLRLGTEARLQHGSVRVYSITPLMP